MQNLSWWKHAVIYQVYPRSFQDSNGDGIGDLTAFANGLNISSSWAWMPSGSRRFIHLRWPTSDTMSPTIAESTRSSAPWRISIACFKTAHDRGLRLILDFVPNHTSDQHPWFIESRSSRENPKRDWYIWRDRAEQLAESFRWVGVGVRREDRAVLPARVLERTA